MMRLIGADSGLTMAITRLAETILPKPDVDQLYIHKLTKVQSFVQKSVEV
jgi:hypothetical protein